MTSRPRPSATQVQPRRAVAATQPAAEANNLPAASTLPARLILLRPPPTLRRRRPRPPSLPVITRGTSSVSAKYIVSVNTMWMIHVYVGRNSYYYSCPFLAALPALLPPSRPGTTQGTISARRARRGSAASVSLRHSPPPAASCDNPHSLERTPPQSIALLRFSGRGTLALSRSFTPTPIQG